MRAKRWVSVMALVAVCWSVDAAADGGEGRPAALALTGAASTPPLLGALITVIANGAYLAKHHRPPGRWSSGMGYVMGSLVLAAGVGFGAFAATDYPSSGDSPSVLYGIGAGLLLAGGGTIALAAMAARQPERAPAARARVSISPVAVFDQRQALCPGVGIVVLGW